MRIRNFGPIRDGVIKLKPMMILLGKNSAGKTFVSYLLYGMLNRAKSIRPQYFTYDTICEGLQNDSITVNLESMKEQFIDEFLASLNEGFASLLADVFFVPERMFEGVNIELSKEECTEYLLSDYHSTASQSFQSAHFVSARTSIAIDGRLEDNCLKLSVSVQTISFGDETKNHQLADIIGNEMLVKTVTNIVNDVIQRYVFNPENTLYFPAERNGMNVFRNELNIIRSNRTQSYSDQSRKSKAYPYPMPISDYLVFVNESSSMKEKVYGCDEAWDYFARNVLEGRFEFDEESQLVFKKRIIDDRDSLSFDAMQVPFHITASSVKSLYGFESYLKNEARLGDFIFIDEPELNLDPDRQIAFAELTMMLKRLGIRFVLSTHSDYFVKAITNDVLSGIIKKEEHDGELFVCYFDGERINDMSDLQNVDYLDHFDRPFQQLEEAYYEYLEKIEEDLKERAEEPV